MSSTRYFITTKTTCDHCKGQGLVGPPQCLVVVGCHRCGGTGVTTGEIEVELTSMPNGTGFTVKDIYELDGS